MAIKTQKVVVIANSNICHFYESIGIKLHNHIETIKAEELFEHHRKQELRTGFYQKGSGPSHFFDPTTEAKDIDRLHFVKEVVHRLSKVFETHKFDGIIITADPKTLGVIRKELPKNLKDNVITDIAKDIVDFSAKDMEEAIFNQKT